MSNYTFYKIVCKNQNVKDCYVGHTINFHRRKIKHKSCCSNEKSPKHNCKIYKFIRDNGGWDEWEMIEIENCSYDNINEAKNKERYWIETLGASLNRYIPNRTKEEYYQDNKDYILQQRIEYYELNKEKLLEYRRNYQKKNSAP